VVVRGWERLACKTRKVVSLRLLANQASLLLNWRLSSLTSPSSRLRRPRRRYILTSSPSQYFFLLCHSYIPHSPHHLYLHLHAITETSQHQAPLWSCPGQRPRPRGHAPHTSSPTSNPRSQLRRRPHMATMERRAPLSNYSSTVTELVHYLKPMYLPRLSALAIRSTIKTAPTQTRNSQRRLMLQRS
jgi:hypothetical protein